MLSGLDCIGAKHDLRLVLLALVVCCIGSVTAVRLFRHATLVTWPNRLAWLFVAAIVAGASTWCTHFIAILAYEAGTPVAFAPLQTVQSLLIAIAGCFAGFLVAARRRHGPWPLLGGGILGLAMSAMHYCGMLAFRIDGEVRWQPAMVVVSVAIAVVLSGLATVAIQLRRARRLSRLAPALLIGAIVSLHFTGMAAITVIPLSAAQPGNADTATALALATAFVGTLIIAAGTLTYHLEQASRREGQARMEAYSATCERTGFLRRPAFEREVARIVKAAKPGQRHIVATIKLFRLNELIERYGRAAGDYAILATAERINALRQPGFVIARTGQSEFTAIGPIPQDEDIPDRAQCFRAALAVPLAFANREILPDPRIGIACFPENGGSAEDLLHFSRLALYRAKTSALECVCVYDETVDHVTQRRHLLANDIGFAAEHGELELHYQPQVWIETGRILGFEALLRWNHPQLGPISPAEFIPLAEASGAIIAIGSWVLQTACRQASLWPADWHVSVNVSPAQLQQRDLPERVLEALVASGLCPDRLEIELTESLLVKDRASALHVLRRIKALGVKLALDDFGTGYSSMDVLRHFPFDKIKLDRSFVTDIDTNPQSLAILRAMLELGRSLQIPILVEGVETEHQLAILRAEGCRKVQGYLTGRPLPAAAIPASRAAA